MMTLVIESFQNATTLENDNQTTSTVDFKTPISPFHADDNYVSSIVHRGLD